GGADAYAVQVVPAVGGGEQRVFGRNLREGLVGENERQLVPQRLGERLACADRVDQQHAAVLEIGIQVLPLGRGEAKLVAAVHEDQVVAKQFLPAGGDHPVVGGNTQFNFPLRGGAQQVGQGAGGVVASPAVAELGDLDDPAARHAIFFVGKLLDKAL